VRWTALNALIVALCIYRLAWFIGRDLLTEPIRQRLGGKLRDWAECPWCCSVWLGVVLLALTHFEWSIVRWGCYVLALSAVAGFLTEHT